MAATDVFTADALPAAGTVAEDASIRHRDRDSSAPAWPLLSGLTTAVTLSPYFEIFEFPAGLLRMLGLPSSMLQCLTAPFSSGTSSSMYACGLVHSNAVTVPASVTRFVVSNIANE